MAYETWWSVHLYTYLALFLVVLAPGRHGRVVRRPSVGARRGGPRCGSARWRSSSASRDRAAAVALAAPPRDASRRSSPRAPARSRSSLDGPPAAPAAGRRRAVPAVALPAPRAVVAGAPVLAVSARRGRAPVGSPSRISATSQRRRSRLRPVSRATRGPRTGRSHPTAPQRDRVLLVGAGVGIGARSVALLQELPAARRRDRRALRAHRRDADLVLPRRASHPRWRAATGGSSSSSAHATRCPLERRRVAPRSCPTCRRATRLPVRRPDALSRQLLAELAARQAVRPTAVHFGCLRLLRTEPMMRRAPVVHDGCAGPPSAPPRSSPSTPKRRRSRPPAAAASAKMHEHEHADPDADHDHDRARRASTSGRRPPSAHGHHARDRRAVRRRPGPGHRRRAAGSSKLEAAAAAGHRSRLSVRRSPATAAPVLQQSGPGPSSAAAVPTPSAGRDPREHSGTTRQIAVQSALDKLTSRPRTAPAPRCRSQSGGGRL